MQYKDLPRLPLLNKLKSTAFESPSLNKRVFDWCKVVEPEAEFLESERVKLVQKYGESTSKGIAVPKNRVGEFAKEFGEVLNMEVTAVLPSLPLTSESFEDNVCRYPTDKNLWISPQDIEILMQTIEKQNN